MENKKKKTLEEYIGEYIKFCDYYILLIRKDIKHMYLRIKPDNNIILTVPIGLSDIKISDFLVDRLSWLNKNVKNRKPIKKLEYIQGDRLCIFDKTYTLNIIYIDNKVSEEKRKKIKQKTKIEGENINIYIYRKNDILEIKEKLMHNLYKEELYPVVKSMVEFWADKMQVEYNEIKIKKVKSIWGSFSTKNKNVTFNSALATKPYNIIEYIVVHELCHSKYPNHGKGFKKMLTFFMPDWEIRKKELGK